MSKHIKLEDAFRDITKVLQLESDISRYMACRFHTSMYINNEEKKEVTNYISSSCNSEKLTNSFMNAGKTKVAQVFDKWLSEQYYEWVRFRSELFSSEVPVEKSSLLTRAQYLDNQMKKKREEIIKALFNN